MMKQLMLICVAVSLAACQTPQEMAAQARARAEMGSLEQACVAGNQGACAVYTARVQASALEDQAASQREQRDMRAAAGFASGNGSWNSLARGAAGFGGLPMPTAPAFSAPSVPAYGSIGRPAYCHTQNFGYTTQIICY